MFLINFDDFFGREINEDLFIVCENLWIGYDSDIFNVWYKMMVGFFLMHNYLTFVLDNEALGLI